MIGLNLQVSMPLNGLMTRKVSEVVFSSGIIDWEGAWCF